MKKLLILIIMFLSIDAIAQKTMNYPQYTLTEVYQMIANEKSDTFTLKNANIILDTVADRNYLLKRIGLNEIVPLRNDSIEIHKSVVFENVFKIRLTGSKYFIGFNKVIFHKSVSITNSNIQITDSHFKSAVSITYNDNLYQSFEENFNSENAYGGLTLNRNHFDVDPFIRSGTVEKELLPVDLRIENCVFKGTSEVIDNFVLLFGFSGTYILDNRFLGNNPYQIGLSGSRAEIKNNDFGNRLLQIYATEIDIKKLYLQENQIHKPVLLDVPESSQNIRIDWMQFSSGITNFNSYVNHLLKTTDKEADLSAKLQNANYIKKYMDSVRIVENLIYKSDISMISRLNAIYRKQHNKESAKASYMVLKDLETKRLQYLYSQEPSFDTFFEWKVNEFLKVFSDYGTRPAKAIVVSVYVILFFAFIYLLFPNTWDSHGKNRIMDRYRFFSKYMDKKAGIHEVFLEEQQQELLASEDFKNYMLAYDNRIPNFFIKTAIPLYKWSIAGKMLSASLLKRVDVMKGTWADLPAKKRALKSILLIGSFLIALVYDIFIKMLNALMLSINTFTTLGFGEIPIKGLPRYLAIIQGFIGWFMLTIFSVSLISQLLN